MAGRNVLREDFPLPVCVLRAAALARNLARFQRFSEDAGVLLCPHAKTSMSPALFGRQLAAGAWGLTFATGAQVRVAREHGVPRIFYANELVGAADIRFVCDQLRRDPGFEFYCLADSVAAVRLLAARVAAARPGRRLNVLVEGGLPGGRCGVRDVHTAVEVAEAVRAAGAHLALAGVEGFEGLSQYRGTGDRVARRPGLPHLPHRHRGDAGCPRAVRRARGAADRGRQRLLRPGRRRCSRVRG